MTDEQIARFYLLAERFVLAVEDIAKSPARMPANGPSVPQEPRKPVQATLGPPNGSGLKYTKGQIVSYTSKAGRTADYKVFGPGDKPFLIRIGNLDGMGEGFQVARKSLKAAGNGFQPDPEPEEDLEVEF